MSGSAMNKQRVINLAAFKIEREKTRGKCSKLLTIFFI